MSNLTKIFCNPIDQKFVILYIRMKEYTRESLNLVKHNTGFRILDSKIRSNLLQTYNEYKSMPIDLESFFNVNCLVASCKRRVNEFTLKQRKFDQEKEVSYQTGTNFCNLNGTKMAPSCTQCRQNIKLRRCYCYATKMKIIIWKKI